MIQQYTFDGTGRQIDAAGQFFRYESGADGSGVTDVRLIVDGNSLGTFAPGDSLELPSDARRWEVRPVSAGCTGTVKIGRGKVSSSKLSGVVQTIDGGRTRSASGSAFAYYAYSPVVASQFSYVQLLNNGQKTLTVNGIVALSNQTNGIVMRSGAVAISGTAGVLGPCKRLGGAPSTADVRVAANGSSSAFSVGPAMLTLLLPASTTQTYRPTEPIVVVPGMGLVFSGTNAGCDIGISIDWFEE